MFCTCMECGTALLSGVFVRLQERELAGGKARRYGE
jgi:hypothetical protein